MELNINEYSPEWKINLKNEGELVVLKYFIN